MQIPAAPAEGAPQLACRRSGQTGLPFPLPIPPGRGTRMTVKLCPTQQHLFDQIVHALPLSPRLVVHAGDGMGKSTLLVHLREHTGGSILPMTDFLRVSRDRHPLALEEAFLEWASAALAETS